jgi:hypothetical protein
MCLNTGTVVNGPLAAFAQVCTFRAMQYIRVKFFFYKIGCRGIKGRRIVRRLQKYKPTLVS